MSVTIYHNPGCSTSRKTLALIESKGLKPKVIEYLKTPPSRSELKAIVKRMGVPLRAILRKKAPPFAELGLDDSSVGDERILDAIEQHPVLIERPIVVTPKGARLCRPVEAVLDIL
jgi:arsenate reductase (glutaredoxin)